MENNNENTGGTNWTPPSTPTGVGQELPGAIASLVTGIIGLALSLFFGCGPVGIVLSIIAFVKGKKAVKEYEANPGGYTLSSYNQAKPGKILGIIGIIFGGLVSLFWILYIAFFGFVLFYSAQNN